MRALLVCLVVGTGCGDDSVEDILEGPSGGYVRTADVSRGRQLYLRHGCAQCHGPKGRGDGRMAASLNPPPRDLHDPEQFRHGVEVEQIEETIRKGVVSESRVMPAYGHLSQGDRRSLAMYIRSLAEVEGREKQRR